VVKSTREAKSLQVVQSRRVVKSRQVIKSRPVDHIRPWLSHSGPRNETWRLARATIWRLLASERSTGMLCKAVTCAGILRLKTFLPFICPAQIHSRGPGLRPPAPGLTLSNPSGAPRACRGRPRLGRTGGPIRVLVREGSARGKWCRKGEGRRGNCGRREKRRPEGQENRGGWRLAISPVTEKGTGREWL
jgi:hypothetical protein